MKDVIIYDSLRTPRGNGRKKGSLYEIKPIRLLEIVLRALQKRHSLVAAEIDDAIIGCVTPIGDQGFNIARTALLEAGMDDYLSKPISPKALIEKINRWSREEVQDERRARQG